MQKSPKVRACFSLISNPIFPKFDFWHGYDPDFAQKENQENSRGQNLSRISKKFQKGRRGPQLKMKFCMVRKGDHVE